MESVGAGEDADQGLRLGGSVSSLEKRRRGSPSAASEMLRGQSIGEKERGACAGKIAVPCGGEPQPRGRVAGSLLRTAAF